MQELKIFLREDQILRLSQRAQENGVETYVEINKLLDKILDVIEEHLEVQENIRFLGQYTDVLVSGEIVKELETLFPSWHKIQMIKHCREKCGFGLRDAKFVVDVLLGQETNLA